MRQKRRTIIFDLRLNTESETHAIRVVRVVVVGVAVVVHIIEVSAVASIRRTKPPGRGATNNYKT